MVSPRYSWEWSILMGLKWCFHSIGGDFLWFQDVVNLFRPMKMRKSGKTYRVYRVTLHTHPAPKYLEDGNDLKSNTHWYQLISLVSLLMVMVSPRCSWEWSILMGLKWCSHSIGGDFLWFQDVVNHFRPMKMRKSRTNISGHMTYTSIPKIPWRWKWSQIKHRGETITINNEQLITNEPMIISFGIMSTFQVFWMVILNGDETWSNCVCGEIINGLFTVYWYNYEPLQSIT